MEGRYAPQLVFPTSPCVSFLRWMDGWMDGSENGGEGWGITHSHDGLLTARSHGGSGVQHGMESMI
jgi:hypothetical protein